MQNWKPTFIFNHYTDITPTWCQQQGIKYILSDLDGTLAAWNEPCDTQFVKWYREIEKVGGAVIITSNNSDKRVREFTETCKLVGYGKCNKPSTHKIKRELLDKGLLTDHCLFLGDQLFTDVWVGQKLGMRTALVEPLGEYEPMVTKSKRWIESLLKKTWKEAVRK
ncbi:YqeG family HAD IIIA-type phosphatase [Priestia megaterium]|nr:YqeG family HAD IIIA-type phosphatase [Priestia megaterium]